MRLSRLLQLLDLTAIIHLEGQAFSVAEMRNWFIEGASAPVDCDPWVSLKTLEHTLDLYNLDLPPHRRLWGWIELARQS